jgi:hypothetical protein
MTQTFYDFMKAFLKEKEAKTIVEVGSDVQLRLAANLASSCQRFCSVNFPIDHFRMRGWYDVLKGMGGQNVELLSGNGVYLSKLIPHADVIILSNLLGICLTRTLSALAESELRAQIPSLKMPTPERASASE